MKQVTKRCCDLCGREIVPNPEYQRYAIWRINPHLENVAYMGDSPKLIWDCCDPCMERLVKDLKLRIKKTHENADCECKDDGHGHHKPEKPHERNNRKSLGDAKNT